MAGGSRTVLLSRWRTGGATSFAAARDFLRHTPKQSPAEAWQQSLAAVRESTLDPQREPRLRRLPAGETVKADHPFFWAGYLLVDPGQVAEAEEDEADAEPPAAAAEKQPPDAGKPAATAEASEPGAKPAAASPQAQPAGPASDPPPKLDLDLPEDLEIPDAGGA
jgi:hypothetical protein